MTSKRKQEIELLVNDLEVTKVAVMASTNVVLRIMGAPKERIANRSSPMGEVIEVLRELLAEITTVDA